MSEFPTLESCSVCGGAILTHGLSSGADPIRGVCSTGGFHSVEEAERIRESIAQRKSIAIRALVEQGHQQPLVGEPVLLQPPPQTHGRLPVKIEEALAAYGKAEFELGNVRGLEAIDPAHETLSKARSALESAILDALALSSRSAEPEGGERRPKPRIQGEGPCLCEHEDDPRRAHRPDCPARKPNPRPRRTPR